MSKPEIMVYWGSGSAPCWRVLITLKEKNLEYKEKILSFAQREHKGSELVKINPRGQLPTVKIDDQVINESMAACSYLEKIYGDHGNRLIPSDKAECALVYQRMFEALNIQKIGGEELAVYLLRTKPEFIDKDLLKSKKDNFLKELQRWEDYLQRLGQGGYIAGKNFTLADVVFYPSMAFMVRVGLELSPKFPLLAAYYERVTTRPSVAGTWPPHWKTSDRGVWLKDLYTLDMADE